MTIEDSIVSADEQDSSDSKYQDVESLNDNVQLEREKSRVDNETLDARRKQAEQEELRYQQLKDRQTKLLSDIINNSKSEGDGVSISPLEVLAKQAEIYTSFMNVKSSGSKSESSAPAETNRRRRKGNEEEEAQENDSLISVTRLLSQPKCIVNGTMRPYQLEGLNWLIALYDTGINGILADEMGLGKTLQTISLLGYLYESRGIDTPHLVIVPKSTLSNWKREFNHWCPSLDVIVLESDKQTRSKLIEERIKPGNFNVLITSYELVLREKAALMHVQWFYMIIDEAHRIKNEESALSIVVRQLQTKYRLLITGTPLQNNLHELWALLNFLMPNVFGSADIFDSYFKTSVQSDVIKRLHTILRPFLLRRLKTDVEKNLPPKKQVNLYVGMTDMQVFWYKNILKKDIEALNSIGGANHMQLQNILMQLRKVCNHPYLFQGAEPGPPYVDGPHLWENSGKMQLLDKLLKKVKEQGSRVLIFTQMTRMLDILEDYLLFKHYTYCRIDGTTSGEDREKRMDEFNAPDSEKFCFILSTRAGGLGINLATADVVILYDCDWNPQADLQAEDRAHRIGQKKTVRVFRLITENAVDEKIIERAERKLLLDAIVIQQGRLTSSNSKLSTKELASIVTHGADKIFASEKGTYTDADIEQIMEIGEQRTMKESLQRKQDINLSSFSIEAKDTFDIYSFGGENFRNSHATSTFINLPSRTKKRDGNEPKAKVSKIRIPYQEFQLYNIPLLQEIVEKEYMLHQTIRSLKSKRKDLVHKNASETQLQEIDAQIERCVLSEEEQRTKESLVREGFPDWSRSDYYCFIQACETHGRKKTTAIVEEVSNATGKSSQEVRHYMTAFWERAPSIPTFKRILHRIEKGEQKIERKGEIELCLARKLSEYALPFEQMVLPQPTLQSGKGFTVENDRFLLCCVAQIGYGKWEQVRQEIQKCREFQFDWFFRTRTASEIQRRFDSLIRLIEKRKAKASEKRKDEDEDVGEKKAKRVSKRRKQGKTNQDA